MRTFHTGGVAGADITHGLPRVVELFEARKPKAAATLAEIGGRIELQETDRGWAVTVHGQDGDGEPVEKEYPFPRRTRFRVSDGEVIEQGTPLNEGPLAPAELLDLRGETETARYLVEQVQEVYKSQGVEIHDKHIELIVRQMLRKVRVDSAGDSETLLPGELVDKPKVAKEIARLTKSKGDKPTTTPIILGITKASLATESFLSAASFQETTKVLTDAAIEGKSDSLRGLKENVIIGKLIPAATGLRRYRSVAITPTDEPPAILAADGAGQLAGAVAVTDGEELDLTPKPGAEEPLLPDEAGE